MFPTKKALNDSNGLMTFAEAKDVTTVHRFVMLVLVVGGTISIVRFADWWFRPSHIEGMVGFVLLSVLFWYSTSRIIFIWFNYLNMRKPKHIPAPEGLSVAIFTTSYRGEPLAMVEKTLAACREIKYPHTTYLLDNTEDPAFRLACERNGAVWLDMVGTKGAKAGKVNHALSQTTEDFILILDPDHIPMENFFDRTLGYFNDEEVGFVQVSQGYYNQYRSFVARGAAEQSYSFYGPTQMGYHGLGCAIAIGANCTFRRRALESIGGHVVGLAEDLQTSLKLHSAGWKSVYNPVIVNRGIVPEDLGSFCKQQLKWAYGSFEVLFVDLPAAFRKLTFWQKITYSSIATYYLNGVSTLIFMLLPFVFLFTGSIPVHMSFAEFIINGGPIVFFSTLIYIYAQTWMCHPATERGFHWRGMILKYACWPVFTLGFLLSLAVVEIPYIPTSKEAEKNITPFAKPLLLYVVFFILMVFGLAGYRMFFMSESGLMLSSAKTWGMIGFAFLAMFMSLASLWVAIDSKGITEENAWEKIKS